MLEMTFELKSLNYTKYTGMIVIVDWLNVGSLSSDDKYFIHIQDGFKYIFNKKNHRNERLIVQPGQGLLTA